jgi:hypothetical protein
VLICSPLPQHVVFGTPWVRCNHQVNPLLMPIHTCVLQFCVSLCVRPNPPPPQVRYTKAQKCYVTSCSGGQSQPLAQLTLNPYTCTCNLQVLSQPLCVSLSPPPPGQLPPRAKVLRHKLPRGPQTRSARGWAQGGHRHRTVSSQQQRQQQQQQSSSSSSSKWSHHHYCGACWFHRPRG